MTKKPVESIPDHLQDLATNLPLTMTLQEAAKVMCMHPRTLQRLIADGGLRATRAKLSGGSRVIITRSEVIRWFAECAAR